MKTSMSLFGCGPNLALLCPLYEILSLIVIFKYHNKLKLILFLLYQYKNRPSVF